jgi:hypothetical protein
VRGSSYRAGNQHGERLYDNGFRNTNESGGGDGMRNPRSVVTV